MRPLTTDMTLRDLRPYFLWDEDVSIGELQQILAGPDGFRRDQLLGKMLREARDIDVWQFVMLLERAGHSVEAALAAALAKDGGCTPATLAWLLSEVKIPTGSTCRPVCLRPSCAPTSPI
ncbi:MAG TPA: hypothetical protein VHW23_26275 [Kofleriaceae bacterium]|jgi:hypothetical protein|nr:hypothetical protein [Kofleriaceae bacterium]